MSSCDHAGVMSLLRSSKDHCAMISQACSGSQNTVNFFSIHFCYLQSFWITIPLVIIVLLLIFKFICDVVEDYVVPAVLFLCEYFKLSQSFGGVTLLALANGLGDVTTAFVASTHSEGVYYIAGSIYGTGLFVFTIGIMCTIFASEKVIRLDRNVIFRDLGVYLLGTILVIIFAVRGSVSLFDASLFFGIYLFFLIVVVIQEYYRKREQRNLSYLISEEEASRMIPHSEDSLMNSDINSIVTDGKNSETSNVRYISHLLKQTLERDVFVNFAQTLSKKQKVPKLENSSGLKSFQKFLGIIDIPFSWIRKLTIFPPSPESFDKKRFLLWPIFGIPLMMWAILEKPSMIWLYYMPFALLISCLFALALSDPEVEQSKRFAVVISIFSLLSAILWMKIVTGALVDVISFIGIISNLPSSFLGFTVIAIGNAISDILTTIAIAKRGQALMGVAGAYAGQVFGLLFGFGASMARRAMLVEEPIPFNFLTDRALKNNEVMLWLIIFTFFTVALTMVWVSARNYKLEKTFAFTLGGIYATFLAYSTSSVFKVMLNS